MAGDTKPHPWLVVNGEPIEVECGICHDIIYLRSPGATSDEQETELREAVARHTKAKHTLASNVDSMP